MRNGSTELQFGQKSSTIYSNHCRFRSIFFKKITQVKLKSQESKIKELTGSFWTSESFLGLIWDSNQWSHKRFWSTTRVLGTSRVKIPKTGSILLKKNRRKLREVKKFPRINRVGDSLVMVPLISGTLRSLCSESLLPSPVDHPSEIVVSTRQFYWRPLNCLFRGSLTMTSTLTDETFSRDPTAHRAPRRYHFGHRLINQV